MTFWSWYAHSWYFNPGWIWCDQIEVGFDLRCWMLGLNFAGCAMLQIGPFIISYRGGL